MLITILFSIFLSIIIILTTLKLFPNYLYYGIGISIILTSILLFLNSKLKTLNIRRLLASLIGFIFGAIFSFVTITLFTPFLTNLNSNLFYFIKFIYYLFNLYIFSYIFYKKYNEFNFFTNLPPISHKNYGTHNSNDNYKILDTSVIIDGRIADISETGFLEGILIIPRFVLNELQQIADSADALKRQRGRRGLDILNKMKKGIKSVVQIVDDDFPEIKEVDEKLIFLAKKFNGKIITNDFNLNKVAQIQGVKVLNINELANAVKPVVLPGEELTIQVIKEGKDHNQGIGYLEDGTMVVVEDGNKYIGKKIDVVVTSVLQTQAGRMIFAK